MPLLVVAGPLTVYVLFLAVPSLRRHWRSSRPPAAPWWWSWLLALVTAVLVAWSGVKFFGTHAVTWPGLAEAGHDPDVVTLAVAEPEHRLHRRLATDPAVRIVDFTGSAPPGAFAAGTTVAAEETAIPTTR